MARILLIDDDDLLRGVLAKSLTHAGHTVVQASDGQQGLDVAQATDIDIVVTDIIMPGQEGVETILRFRREYPLLPIIAISGGASYSQLYLEIAAKIGARRVLPKPFTPRELMAEISDVLGRTNDTATPAR